MTLLTRQILRKQQQQLAGCIVRPSIVTGRLFSTSPVSREAPTSASTAAPAAKPHTIDPRWFTQVKTRIGKCLMFGLKPAQVVDAGDVLRQLARDWRELIAGSEGYLTGKAFRGLFKHNVVWGEMDSMGMCISMVQMISEMANRIGHVNNVTYVRYAETARVNYTRNFATYLDPGNREKWVNIMNNTGIGLILRSIKTDFKFPMKYPDKITVYHKLANNPSTPKDPSAFELQVMILSETWQRPAARCHEDIVTYDYQQAKKSALPPFMHKQFQKTWDLQEQAKTEWQQRILEIESRVRMLELESWDREDAVEDTGS